MNKQKPTVLTFTFSGGMDSEELDIMRRAIEALVKMHERRLSSKGLPTRMVEVSPWNYELMVVANALSTQTLRQLKPRSVRAIDTRAAQRATAQASES